MPDNGAKHRQRASFPLRFWVLAIYVALVLAPNNVYLSEGVRLALVRGRPAAFIMILALIAVAALREPVAVRAYLRNARLRRLAILALAFPVFYVLIAGLKSELRLETVLLYMTWTIAVFVLWPLFARTRQEQFNWVTLLLTANLIAWLLPLVYSPFGPPVQLPFSEINSYGHLNPDYFAQCVQTVFACAFLFQARERQRIVLRAVVLVASALTIYSLAARSAILFLVVVVIAMPALRIARRPGLVVSALLVVSLVAGALASSFFARTEIDRFSSGRIEVWTESVRQAFEEGDDLSTFLIGPDHLPSGRSKRSGYDPLGDRRRFTKFHIDNAYLELFLESGALGMVLFIIPYLLAIVVALRRIRERRERRDVWAVGVLVALGCQSAVSVTIPSFANPIAFLFITALGVALGPVRTDRP